MEKTKVEFIPMHIRARLSTPWHIEPAWGMEMLGKYMMNSESGYVAAFERMKAMYAPVLIDMNGDVVLLPENKDAVMASPGQVMRGTVPPGSILRINLMGPMTSEGDMCSWGMYDYEEAIRAASNNPNVDGIFIRANTGGGESTAGQILHNAVKSSKKAVVVFAEFLASAGIHGTLAADEIIASSTGARFGSIGTYASIDKEFLTWYKENVEDIYADVSPDKNKEFRAFLAGDSGPLRASITENAKLFQAEVRAFRQLGSKADDTLRGGVFPAPDARSRGLVDGIGDMDYALSRLQANINKRKKNSTR